MTNLVVVFYLAAALLVGRRNEHDSQHAARASLRSDPTSAPGAGHTPGRYDRSSSSAPLSLTPLPGPRRRSQGQAIVVGLTDGRLYGRDYTECRRPDEDSGDGGSLSDGSRAQNPAHSDPPADPWQPDTMHAGGLTRWTTVDVGCFIYSSCGLRLPNTYL